jgi:hypothetical protein
MAASCPSATRGKTRFAVLPRTLPHAHSFRAQEPAAARTSALGSVMQPKAAAADRALESEAEALRKNPLKNYPGQEWLVGGEDGI